VIATGYSRRLDTLGSMELVPYSEADIDLLEELECDPELMRNLGGPVSKEDLPGIHERRLATVEAGEWFFKIVLDDERAGTIGIWSASWRDEPIHEAGWMVLKRFQGQGVATRALSAILDRARTEDRFPVIDAFPSVDNTPSNALCRKHGFSLLEEIDFPYRGITLRCNRWELELKRRPR
jgi:RimJ/RimL family protein N-acetyltransferase